MADQAFARVAQDFFPLVGGLDEESPPIVTRPGSIIGSQNYDVAVHGGYRRIDGYERFDGRPRPSDAHYTVMNMTGTIAATVGDTITGSSSGATAVVLDQPTGQQVVGLVTGTFLNGESIGATPDPVGIDPATFAEVVSYDTAQGADVTSLSVTITPTYKKSLFVAIISVWKLYPGTGSILSAENGWVSDSKGQSWTCEIWNNPLIETASGCWYTTNQDNDAPVVTVQFVCGTTFNGSMTVLEFVDHRELPRLIANDADWVVEASAVAGMGNSGFGTDPIMTSTGPTGHTHSIAFAGISTNGSGGGGSPDPGINIISDSTWTTMFKQEDATVSIGAEHVYKFIMSNTTITWDIGDGEWSSDWAASGMFVKISASSGGGVISNVTEDGADTIDLHLAYKCLAADATRTAIAAVPGTGPVLGVVRYNDVVYAFRRVAAEGGLHMFKSHPTTGWTVLGPWWYLTFDTGSGTPPAVGATLTQGAQTMRLDRIVILSGSFAGGNAVGRLYGADTSPSGTFAVGAFTAGITANVSATTDDPFGTGVFWAFDTAPEGRRMDFAIGNITGGTDGQKLYIVGGNNRPVEFDGTTAAFIDTGMPATQFPTHVAIHKKHLFLSYAGSLQHSAIGNPWSWTLLTGAAELNVGDTITSIISQVSNDGSSGALAVFSRNSTRMLYGSSSSDWNLVTSSPDTGALEWTAQNIGIAMYLDDRGLMLMRSVQEFGNFEHSSVSRKTQRFFDARRGTAVASTVLPSRNQYRLFFSDGSVAAVTMEGRKILGIAQLALTNPATCAWTSEDSNGTERIFFGSTNGFVYEMERGTSFDGLTLPASLRLSFQHSRSPELRKRYRLAVFETKVAARATLQIQADLSYGESDPAAPNSATEVVYGGGGYYDVNAYYNQTFYDSPPFSRVRYKLDGVGRNVGFLFANSSRCEPSHVITGATLHYSPRRLER